MIPHKFELVESYSETGTGLMINLADVCHVETRNGRTYIITRHTTWDENIEEYDNAAMLKGNDALHFIDRLCLYWSERERERVGTIIVRIEHDAEGQSWTDWAVTIGDAQRMQRIGMTLEQAIIQKMIDAREVK